MIINKSDNYIQSQLLILYEDSSVHGYYQFFILGNNHQSLAMVIRLRDDFAFIGVFIDVGGVFILKMQLLYTG